MRRGTAGILAAVTILVGAGCLYEVVDATSFQLFGGLTQRADTTDKVVALTFDDGPTCPDVDTVLESLNGTPATFFVLGSETETCPDGARRLVDGGSELGNHTWSHGRMVGVTPQEVADEIEPTDTAIRAAGQTGEILFRPPYGKKLAVLPWWLDRHHRRTIMWDVAVETFDGEPQSAGDITRETISRVRPGSIVLLHPWNGRTETQKAIAPIIAGLRQRGYTFVTASELADR